MVAAVDTNEIDFCKFFAVNGDGFGVGVFEIALHCSSPTVVASCFVFFIVPPRVLDKASAVVAFVNAVVVVEGANKAACLVPRADVDDAILNLQVRLMLKQDAVVDGGFVSG